MKSNLEKTVDKIYPPCREFYVSFRFLRERGPTQDQTTVAPRLDTCVAMEADNTVDPRIAELRRKYDETTRLLSAQCDTIEGLQSQIRTLQRQPGTGAGDETQRTRDEDEGVGESCPGVVDDSTTEFETKYRRAKRLVKMQAVEVATLRERVQRRETSEASLQTRVAQVEEALRVTQASASTLGEDYAAALETAERGRAHAMRERHQALSQAETAMRERHQALAEAEACRGRAASFDSELTRARTLALVADASARDASAQRDEDACAIATLTAKLASADQALAEMPSLRATTHDAQIEVETLTVSLACLEKRAREARAEFLTELEATKAATTAAHTALHRYTAQKEETDETLVELTQKAETAEKERTIVVEKLAVAESDYAHAEQLTVDAVRSLETERAQWEKTSSQHEQKSNTMQVAMESMRAQISTHQSRALSLEETMNRRIVDQGEAATRTAALIVAAACSTAWGQIAVAMHDTRSDSNVTQGPSSTPLAQQRCHSPSGNEPTPNAGREEMDTPVSTPRRSKISKSSPVSKPNSRSPKSRSRTPLAPKRAMLATHGVRQVVSKLRGKTAKLVSRHAAERTRWTERADRRVAAAEARASRRGARLERRLSDAEARVIAATSRWNDAGAYFAARVDQFVDVEAVKEAATFMVRLDAASNAASEAIAKAESATAAAAARGENARLEAEATVAASVEASRTEVEVNITAARAAMEEETAAVKAAAKRSAERKGEAEIAKAAAESKARAAEARAHAADYDRATAEAEMEAVKARLCGAEGRAGKAESLIAALETRATNAMHAAARAETAADENWACFEDANATREAAEKTAQALLEQLAEVEALAATTTANATADVASATQAAREATARAETAESRTAKAEETADAARRDAKDAKAAARHARSEAELSQTRADAAETAMEAEARAATALGVPSGDKGAKAMAAAAKVVKEARARADAADAASAKATASAAAAEKRAVEAERAALEKTATTIAEATAASEARAIEAEAKAVAEVAEVKKLMAAELQLAKLAEQDAKTAADENWACFKDAERRAVAETTKATAAKEASERAAEREAKARALAQEAAREAEAAKARAEVAETAAVAAAAEQDAAVKRAVESGQTAARVLAAETAVAEAEARVAEVERASMEKLAVAETRIVEAETATAREIARAKEEARASRAEETATIAAAKAELQSKAKEASLEAERSVRRAYETVKSEVSQAVERATADMDAMRREAADAVDDAETRAEAATRWYREAETKLEANAETIALLEARVAAAYAAHEDAESRLETLTNADTDNVTARVDAAKRDEQRKASERAAQAVSDLHATREKASAASSRARAAEAAAQASAEASALAQVARHDAEDKARLLRESVIEAQTLRREADKARAHAEASLDQNNDALRHAQSRIKRLQDAFAESANRAASAEAELGQMRRAAENKRPGSVSASSGSETDQPVTSADRETRWREAQARQASIVSKIHKRVAGAAAVKRASDETPSPAVVSLRQPFSATSPAVEKARAQARAALESIRDVAEALESSRSTPEPSGQKSRGLAAATLQRVAREPRFQGRIEFSDVKSRLTGTRSMSPQNENTPPAVKTLHSLDSVSGTPLTKNVLR